MKFICTLMLHIMFQPEQERPQFTGAIVPHPFRNHQAYSTLCKHNTHLDNYCHVDLQCGKVLSGYDLGAGLKDTLTPFLTEEATNKLAPVGSSQHTCRSQGDMGITNRTLNNL